MTRTRLVITAVVLEVRSVRAVVATYGVAEYISRPKSTADHRYHGTGKPTGGPKGPRKIKRTGPQ